MRDRRDLLPIGLTLVHAGALVAVPSIATVALGLWWNANAISHQHVHRRFFKRRAHDVAFSAWLSLLLGLPQRWWRARHLAHHAGSTPGPRRLRRDPVLRLELTLVAAAWTAAAWLAPAFVATTYLPGFALGLLLCGLHGQGEHARGTTSCYGRMWNTLFLNDGYHVEHHAHPSLHVRDLPAKRATGTRNSRWPPVLRGLGVWRSVDLLDACERLALRCAPLRRLVLRTHRRALYAVLGGRQRVGWSPQRIGIVGGGLFPRSALLLGEMFPRAQIVLLDAEPRHLERARALLAPAVELRCAHFTPGDRLACDLAVVPLALRGDRAAVYRTPPAALCLVHDWLWRRRGSSAVVAWWLLKRVNLVSAETADTRLPAHVAATSHRSSTRVHAAS
ncbi:MAG: fatty acid desaturase [Planctomycetota bacterium]